MAERRSKLKIKKLRGLTNANTRGLKRAYLGRSLILDLVAVV